MGSRSSGKDVHSVNKRSKDKKHQSLVLAQGDALYYLDRGPGSIANLTGRRALLEILAVLSSALLSMMLLSLFTPAGLITAPLLAAIGMAVGAGLAIGGVSIGRIVKGDEKSLVFGAFGAMTSTVGTGAAIGAFVGSVVPGIGTAAGVMFGAMIGATLSYLATQIATTVAMHDTSGDGFEHESVASDGPKNTADIVKRQGRRRGAQNYREYDVGVEPSDSLEPVYNQTNDRENLNAKQPSDGLKPVCRKTR